MNDLISRKQAIDALREKLAEYVPYLYSRKVEEIPLECEMTIRNLPQKTGKWIHKSEYGLYPYDILTCSACGETDARMYRSDEYCPHCGARMVGEEE